MKNSVSNESFNYTESEDEDEEKWNRDEDDSDSSHSSMVMRQGSTPNAYSNAWPQSYRQSIDSYSNVASPNVGFLGNSYLSMFGSSPLSSSLTLRHTAEITKPFLPTAPIDVEQQHQSRSSYSLLCPNPAKRSLISKTGDSEYKPSRISTEFTISQGSTFGQALLNGINVLCGVGILSTPYAVKEGGWLSLAILLMFAVLSFYTGLLLRYCLDSAPGLETYPDIGQAAFGKLGRIVISIILYVELYACCVEYIILESDNLSSLFPNAHLTLLGYELDSYHLFALAATLVVLPTCWVRDLSILSYVSVGGVIASVLVFLCLFWVGLVDQVGFVGQGTTLHLSTLPVTIGLYGYCYSGHAVYPNIYTSMANRSQYPAVLLTCFAICTFMCVGAAVLGYLMFGESTQSQFTLNMPQNLVASKVAVWTTVVNPFTKYALIISPVAMSLEELIPSYYLKSHMYPILIRTALVISTLLVGLNIPFFGLVMALIGSLLTMLVTLILPCACYLSILRKKATYLQISACLFTMTVGVISSASGTYSAVSQIIENLI
ncbi:amino acid transporter AVT1C isoform X2 [Beta vulgaris subsp. vulgaris]|uniref:amino acid transporter AVT1C isoform X2 n=1 Tax=Beta vulgaris subsp. vulgaris TaxID=3555 RepID=UPI002036FDE7|nr:amino acid transporter AVT1C isoform X2 [Beta vulgaris subsp. vulgaris]